MGYKVAVVGATGNVGREILNVLAERKFPTSHVAAVASETSLGHQVSFGEEGVLDVESLKDFDFNGYDFVFFGTTSAVSAKYAPLAAAAGAVVIDNSSHFRMDPTVPLIVPEVNGDILSTIHGGVIIANPNCVAVPLAMTLKPLMKEAGVKRVVVSTYQSVSGAGRKAMDELFNQTRAIYMNQPLVQEEFQKRIAFNLIPQIDNFEDKGFTGEERKVQRETQKITEGHFGVAVTCVRVPVFVGHSLSVAVELEAPLAVGEARALWRETPGLSVIDLRADEGYVTPEEVVGEDDVFISRIRADDSVENGLLYWVVSDNLRKGAALNAVQIAEVVCGHLAGGSLGHSHVSA